MVEYYYNPYALSAKHLLDEFKGDNNMDKKEIDLQDILIYSVAKDKNSFINKLAERYDTSIEYMKDTLNEDIALLKSGSSEDAIKLYANISTKDPIELTILCNLEYNEENSVDAISKILVNILCFRHIDKLLENSSNIDVFRRFIYEEFEDIDFKSKYEDINIDTLFSFVTNDIIVLYNFFKQKFAPVVKKYADADIDFILDAYFWPSDDLEDIPYYEEVDNEIQDYTKYIIKELSDKILSICLDNLYSSNK